MPPRYTYWTIILDGAPTAFRASDREALLPTLRQIQARNPDAALKWFARGRVWESPEDAKAAAARRSRPEPRGRDWRPGGAHKDPRERFKKETFQARKRRDKKAAGLAGDRKPAGRPETSRVQRGDHAPDRVGTPDRGHSPGRGGAPDRGHTPDRGRTQDRGGASPRARTEEVSQPAVPAPPHESRLPRLRKPRG